MNDTKRDEIKLRISEAHARDAARLDPTLGERISEGATQAKEKFVNFAKAHPVATVAGGLAVGVLVAAMFRAPRRAAMAGGVKAASLATIGGEIALGFAAKLLEGAQDASREGASKLGEAAETLRTGAADRAEIMRDAGKEAVRNVVRKLGRS